MRLAQLFVVITIQLLQFSSLFGQSTAKENSRDYVTLKNGHVVIGSITNMVDSFGMEITSELGTPIFIPFKDIRRAHRRPPLVDLRNAVYGEIGITYGTPGGINFVAGLWAKKMGVRISGMHYGGNFSAIQVHLGHKITDDNRRRQTIGFSYGRMGDLSNSDWTGFAGFAYSYTGPPLKLKKRHHGWFAEIGYGVYFNGNKNDSAGDRRLGYGPMIQVGYVYRFIEHAPRFEQIPIPKFKKPRKKRPRRPKIIKEKVIVKKEIVRPRIKKEVVKNITKVEKVKIVKRKKPCPKCPETPECPECPEVVKCPEMEACPECPVCSEIPENSVSNSIEKNDEKPLPTYLLIRDNGFPDGDKISIKWNGKLVLDNYELTKESKKVYVESSGKKKNLLSIVAHNMGKTFPNTSFITFVNEETGKKQRYNIEIEAIGEQEYWVKN